MVVQQTREVPDLWLTETQNLKFVTGFGKTCIFHTSDFAHSKVHNTIGKTSGSKIFWTNKGIVALQSLQDSCLSDMHSRFYSKIQTHYSINILLTINHWIIYNLLKPFLLLG